jgi:putative membrane protein
MDRIDLKHIRLEGGLRFSGLASAVYWVLFAGFALEIVVVCLRLRLQPGLFGEAGWPEGLLVLLAAATSIAGLARQLPGQNVMLASFIIAMSGSAAHTLGALTGIPFGPFEYTKQAGPQLFHPLPWVVPMIWLAAIFTCRGVARVVLTPWRERPNYGLWVLGLSVLLVVLLDLSLEPFATVVKHYWSWQPTRISSTWYGVPWVNFLGWGITALALLVFATPSLINKKPGKPAPDIRPVFVWLLLNILFLAAALTHGLWAAAAMVLVQSVLVAVLAAYVVAGMGNPQRVRK